ncbi:hypothetical protein D3C78_1234030 [compost metagenome]
MRPTATTASSSSSTSRSGWRARPSSPTSSCRPAPSSSAGTSANGAIPAVMPTMATPWSITAWWRCSTSASNRSASRVRTTTSSRPSSNGWASAACSPKAAASSTGSSGCSTPPTCRTISPGASSAARAITSSRRKGPNCARRSTCAGSPKAVPRTCRSRFRCRRSGRKSSARACRRRAASWSSFRKSSSATPRTIPTGRRSTVTSPPGKAWGRPTWSPSIRCR